LRGFLRRELDFFIKNEGLLIDELIGSDRRDLGRHVQLGEVLHQVAEAIIDFLAQVDGFRGNSGRRGSSYSAPGQYCSSIDPVPKRLRDEVVANKDQMSEWRELYGRFLGKGLAYLVTLRRKSARSRVCGLRIPLKFPQAK
jgi:adenine-specific DNA-methyltransferase